jgi:hypothetical protein
MTAKHTLTLTCDVVGCKVTAQDDSTGWAFIDDEVKDGFHYDICPSCWVKVRGLIMRGSGQLRIVE